MDSNPANSSWPEAAELKRSLVERADSVADRSKFLVRRRAVFIWLTLVLAASSLLVLCDAFWQYDEKGLRLLAFLSLVTLAAYWLWKVVLPAWGFAPTKADAARWLDRRSGSKAQRNQALTLVELADVPNEDARFGSQDFRQVAIEQSVKRVAENNWDSVLNERPINGQSLALLAVLSAIALFFLVSPKRSWIGVQRLMLPLSSVQWPKSDLLDFRGLPDAVSLGTVLQVEVVDQVPPLPSRVELEIRYSDEPNQVLRQKMELVDDVAFSTLAQVQRSFEIRAVGGEDDSMPWRSVEVMRAPSFESFRFRVDPPEYANQDSFYLVSRRIQVLRGSRVQLSLTLTDAVTSVRMELQIDESGGDSVESQEVVRSEQRRPAMRMDALNRSLTIGGEDGWAANDALKWQFVVETQDGYSVRLPAIWSVGVVDDEVPSIAFAESEMPFLTSEGVLSLSGRATDDIELAEVSAVVSLQDSQSGQVVSHRVNVWNSIEGSETAQELDLNFEVRPADFAELDGEGPITIWLEAVDSKGQKAKSSERMFSIKESSELVEALGDQMSELVEQLAAVVGAQRRNRILVQRVGKLVAETSLVGDQELESLFSASQVQDSISQQLDGDK